MSKACKCTCEPPKKRKRRAPVYTRPPPPQFFISGLPPAVPQPTIADTVRLAVRDEFDRRHHLPMPNREPFYSTAAAQRTTAVQTTEMPVFDEDMREMSGLLQEATQELERRPEPMTDEEMFEMLEEIQPERETIGIQTDPLRGIPALGIETAETMTGQSIGLPQTTTFGTTIGMDATLLLDTFESGKKEMVTLQRIIDTIRDINEENKERAGFSRISIKGKKDELIDRVYKYEGRVPP